MKPSSRPHYVDESTETVYVTVSGLFGAMAAPHWVKKNFPGYKCSIVSEEQLKKKFNVEEND